MKKILFVMIAALLSLVLLLPIGAESIDSAADTTIGETAEETTDYFEGSTEQPAEVTTVPDASGVAAEVTTVPNTSDMTTETATPDTDSTDEEYIPFDVFLLRVWNEYRDTLFAALSSLLSMIIAIVFKNRFIPSVRALVGSQDKKLDAMAKANNDFIKQTQDKLDSFENYDDITKQMKTVLAGAQLDREVLIKVIEMQAAQVNSLIEFSNLPQARKDKIYDGYRAQLCEIERLRGGGSDEA